MKPLPKARHAAPREASGTRGSRGRMAALVLGLAVILGVVGGAWWRRPIPPPHVDLSRTSPAVREAIEGHLRDLGTHPRSATSWGQLGSILYAYRLFPPARQTLRQAERLDPANPRWPYLHALTWIAENPHVAEAHLRRAVVLGRDQPPAPRLRLARLLAEAGRWDEVQSELKALLAMQPVPPHALLLAAQAALERGHLEEASAWIGRAQEDPAVAKPALRLLAAIRARLGDAAGAREAAARSAEAHGSDLFIDPYDADAQALRADPSALSERVHPLLAQRRLSDAAEVVGRMTRNFPEYPDSWLAAGRLALLRRDAPEAERHFRQHLALDADSVQGWFQLGMALLAQQKDLDAAAAFGEAVTRKPDLSPAWHNRGLALGRIGRRDEAMGAFRETLRLSPEHLDAYLLLADLLLQARDGDAAMKLLDQASRLRPDDPRIAALRRRAEGPR